jgi:osmoprotectant transport system permease protein
MTIYAPIQAYLLNNFSEIIQRTLEHFFLVSTSVFIATLIGIPLGILLSRYSFLSKIVLGFANIVQTIPSLALFGFLIPLPYLGGIGTRTAIISLVLYSLLPIIHNTTTGITSIDPVLRQAAESMGMTHWQLLIKLELPLASKVILAGIRISAVTSVGIATIAAAIGAGGLGVYIFRGVSMVDHKVILAGAIPAAILAIVIDVFMGFIEKRLAKT